MILINGRHKQQVANNQTERRLTHQRMFTSIDEHEKSTDHGINWKPFCSHVPSSSTSTSCDKISNLFDGIFTDSLQHIQHLSGQMMRLVQLSGGRKLTCKIIGKYGHDFRLVPRPSYQTSGHALEYWNSGRTFGPEDHWMNYKHSFYAPIKVERERPDIGEGFDSNHEIRNN